MDFLEEILEQREQLEIAKAQKNLAKVRGARRRDAVARPTRPSLPGSRRCARATCPRRPARWPKVRYFNRFLEEVDAIEEGVA